MVLSFYLHNNYLLMSSRLALNLAFLLLHIVSSAFVYSSAGYAAMQRLNDAPIELESDHLTYTKDKITASGNVYVEQSGDIMIADNVEYKKSLSELFLKGNVTLLKDNRDVFFGDKALLYKDKNKGIITNFRARLQEDSLMAAKNAQMIDSNTMKMDDLVFSPCKICKDNIRPYIPMWQIRASEATLNNQQQKIYYKKC